MLNGHVESFNGRLRGECLNANWFRNLEDGRNKISAWLNEYNSERSHSSPGYRTPDEFAAILKSSVGYWIICTSSNSICLVRSLFILPG
jgi:Integrase core domain